MNVDPTPQPGPEPDRSHDTTGSAKSRRAAFGGVAIGALAVVVSLLAFAGGATAQDPPSSESAASTPSIDPDDAGDVGDDAADKVLDSVFVDNNADFSAFEACLDENLGIAEGDGDGAGEAIGEDRWLAAEEACSDHLPEELLEMEKAFEEFDDCLAEHGIDVDGGFEVFDAGPVVFVEDDATGTVATFGDGDGSIAITKTGDSVEVTSSGDVEVIEQDFAAMDEAFEAAHDACEEFLPDDGGLFFAGEFEIDLDELEDADFEILLGELSNGDE